jgi:hypothetical protein
LRLLFVDKRDLISRFLDRPRLILLLFPSFRRLLFDGKLNADREFMDGNFLTVFQQN